MKITAVHGFLGLPADWMFLTEHFDVEMPEIGSIPPRGDILLGYSMGGRLALHALLNGATYRQAVIVSSGLGVEGEARPARLASDEQWARVFESAPWDEAILGWNAQPVLRGSAALPRREHDFDRRELARQLREWSPAVLPPIASRLSEIRIPVLWVAGERDQKYVDEGRRAVSLLPKAELWICPGAGHRVPWDQPELFAARLQAL